MRNLVLVMLGGALGAGARYGVGLFALRQLPGFPWGTLIVNLAGSLLMGVLAGSLGRQLGGPLWLFLGVGVLGGFTTFSAFSFDAVTLIERGALGGTLGYFLASVLGALTLFAGGFALARAPA